MECGENRRFGIFLRVVRAATGVPETGDAVVGRAQVGKKKRTKAAILAALQSGGAGLLAIAAARP